MSIFLVLGSMMIAQGFDLLFRLIPLYNEVSQEYKVLSSSVSVGGSFASDGGVGSTTEMALWVAVFMILTALIHIGTYYFRKNLCFAFVDGRLTIDSKNHSKKVNLS